MAITQYCQPSDLPQGLNAVALSSIPYDEQVAACVSASGMMDDGFRGRFPLPLLSIGPSVVLRAVHIACKLAIDARGNSPMRGDASLEKNYDDAMEWVRGVQRQTIHPDVTFTVPAPQYQLPQVSSPNQPRGWTSRGVGS